MVVNALKCDFFGRLDECEIPDVQNPPPTRSQKQGSKSVHFADTKGLALTSIFFFPKENYSAHETRRKIIKYFKDNTPRDPGTPAKLLNFKSPIPYKDNQVRVGGKNVCLEKIVCNTFGIYGRINVKNLAFEKDVSVRYTFDGWQTFQDAYANYISGASVSTTDTFFFHIKPPQTSENRKMEFAIRYKVNGEEFWDNNHGDNYRLVYFKSLNTVDLSITTQFTDRNI